jgi:formylmethanofuran:tetrahydromethanopterin formyltransferase
MIKKMAPVAKEYDFEIYGSIPATIDKEPNFSSELSKSYTVFYTKNKKETKSLKDWLKTTKIPKDVKITLKDGKKVDALSKQVFVAIKNGTPLDQLVADKNEYKSAIDGFVTYLATMQLGDSVLKAMESPLGAVEDQEGVVIRDKSIYDKPFKITGSFILRGLATSF